VKKIFLAGVNSKFNHVNLAIRSIESYVRLHAPSCVKNNSAAFTAASALSGSAESFELLTGTFTINQPLLQILRGIALCNSDVVLFSVYIWNSEIVFKLIPELRKILPHALIGAGGPEVSYEPQLILARVPQLDFIMAGEGEQTVTAVCEAVCHMPEDAGTNVSGTAGAYSSSAYISAVSRIPGIWSRGAGGVSVFAGPRQLFKTLDELPFPYDDGTGHLIPGVDAKNSIIYYESSRGCPFSCSYCLSSVDKSVRFSSLERVCKDLQFFLDNNVTLVKFVDRTYNLNEDRYIAIWRFIISHWNGITTFHFEIAAQQISSKALDAIQSVPAGMMQFEIGIQSTNPPTLEQVGRNADMNQISSVLSRIPKTIHVHLDLIAGLPFESPAEFACSFNYTIARRPQMLQFGFLKILSGTAMESYAKATPRYEWLSVPPYEVLSSPWVSYAQMQHYKDIEEVLDIYYNEQNNLALMSYLIGKAEIAARVQASCCCTEQPSASSGCMHFDMYAFFEDVASYYAQNGLAGIPHKSADQFRYLYEFMELVHDKKYACTSGFDTLCDQSYQVLYELLRFDFIRREKPGTFPGWYKRQYDKNAHREALEECGVLGNKNAAGTADGERRFSTRDAFTYSSYEEFSVNPLDPDPVCDGRTYRVLFLYEDHSAGASSKTELRSRDSECILLDNLLRRIKNICK
jgi:radical SAM superfamily enzyme YgiQ (UPF0313 family)